MKLFVGQIYLRPGEVFPFTMAFQQWLTRNLSARVEASAGFEKRAGVGYALGFRMSAREGLEEPEILGPTFFRRDKEVEFSIFLPFQPQNYHAPTVPPPSWSNCWRPSSRCCGR